ncbi:MAG: LysM peptidoglycan-binding domain-containing protein [Pseudobdellovibrionaceae bacterium]
MQSRKTASVIASVVFLFAGQSFAQENSDQPDLQKELRFHQIYRTYNEAPLTEEVWSPALGKVQSQTYAVQKGDTLWSLSETLFGETQFWPKIWSLNNNEVENPHDIFPDQTLEFTPGTLMEPPALAVTDGQTEGAEDPGAPAPAESLAVEEGNEQWEKLAQIPEPQYPEKKAAKVPSSIPNWIYRKTDPKSNPIEFEVTKINRDFGSPESFLTYYASETNPESLGEIVETEMGMSSAAEFQYVVVRLNPGVSEKNFMVVKSVDPLEDPVSRSKGILIQVQGSLEVMEIVNTEKNLYRALIRRVINPVEVGGQLLAGELPTLNSRDEGPGPALKATIIGGQFERNRQLFGDESLVILNKGTSQGITVGQSFSVFKQQAVRLKKTASLQNSRQIGKVKVVKATENFSTAVVIQASDDIQVGDTTDSNTSLE